MKSLLAPRAVCVLLVMLACSAMLLAACGDDDTPSATVTATGTQSQPANGRTPSTGGGEAQPPGPGKWAYRDNAAGVVFCCWTLEEMNNRIASGLVHRTSEAYSGSATLGGWAPVTSFDEFKNAAFIN